MTDDPKLQPKGVVLFACDLNRGRKVDCSSPGCTNRSTKQCDHVVTSRTTGTCDRPLCDRCAWEQKPGVDLCIPHAKRYKALKGRGLDPNR